MSTTSPPQSQDKVHTRPYKCPYPECGRAFSRLEHQVLLIFRKYFLISANSHQRLATSVHTPERSHFPALSKAVKSGSPAPMSLHAIRGYTTTIDTTTLVQNPGQRTLLSHRLALPLLDRTTGTPSPPVESRRRPRVVPTATTRCGIHPSPFNSSLPFHLRANTTLGPLPFTQQIPLRTQPTRSFVMTRRVSPSCPTQPPSPHSRA